jgi:hypothetical protein
MKAVELDEVQMLVIKAEKLAVQLEKVQVLLKLSKNINIQNLNLILNRTSR